MTNVARAHSFDAWFTSNAPERIAAALADMSATDKIFDRYSDEIWGMALDRAEAAGENLMEWVGEFFGVIVDSMRLFKNLLVRFACETLAVDLLMPVAA